MVRTLLAGLAGTPGLTVHHVNFSLSRDAADIGRWRAGKIVRTVGFAWRAVAARFRHGCDTLYYVPAPPGKRGALFRDWIVLAICRPFFPRLVLHWHAGGLGAWLDGHATGIERFLSRLLLGRAALTIVLADALRDDGERLRARRIAVVPNGVADPGPPPPPAPAAPWQALFLGLCAEEKGLFSAAAAVIAANRRIGAGADAPAFTLVAAGAFPDAATETRFAALAASHPGVIRHAGFADDAAKSALFAASRCLLFPTRYAAETFSLVALEALAHDRPVIATRWRALPEIVAPECGRIVPPGDEAALADALLALRAAPAAPGVCRARFLAHYTRERHLAALRAALLALDATSPA